MAQHSTKFEERRPDELQHSKNHRTIRSGAVVGDMSTCDEPSHNSFRSLGETAIVTFTRFRAETTCRKTASQLRVDLPAHLSA